MSRARVVVTGLGVVSALATERAAHLTALWAGRSGVRALTPDEQRYLGVPALARVAQFDRRATLRTRILRNLLEPAAAFAVAAAGQALREAGLADDPTRLANAGLYVGSLALGLDTAWFLPAVAASLDARGRLSLPLFATRGSHHVDPLVIVKGLPNAGLCGTAIDYGIKGRNVNLSNGAASGLQAIACAVSAIRNGRAQIAVAGGYDVQTIADLIEARRLSAELSEHAAHALLGARPFARERDGFVPGEAAAFCVLEAEESARARGANVLAHVLATSHGFSAARDPEARALALAELLADTQAAAPDAVFAAGLGTRIHDATEAWAIRAAWPRAEPFVTAATGATGFTGAASGVLSFVHACQALAIASVPPTTGCDLLDEDLRVSVASVAQQAKLERAIVMMGGDPHQVAVALGRPA